ncbi:hypothetical protein BV25DRAFT_1994954 [Artomyces pyxidatus]|uniref:Uncharacterized protein n=1 Tax=Artomyces pyxidatus TaxID=48021 RepID=A0ACB8SN88_9AGAM|nr:hypothetical protein BV25DRAFT_1994954 [Artomyces pyxidatus]
MSLLPEQYLTLLDLARNAPSPSNLTAHFNPWFPSEDFEPKTPFFTPSKDDEFPCCLLDALASISVHQPQREAIATALSLTTGQVTLYVAANGDVHPETVTHLQRTWGRLISVAQGGRNEMEPDISSSKALQKSIYAFHMAKLRRRFDKYFDPFVQAFMPEVRRSQDLNSDDITRLESLLHEFQLVRDVLDSKTISEDQRSRDVARYMAGAEKDRRVALATNPDKRVHGRHDDILLRCPQEVHDDVSGRSFFVRKHLAKLFEIQGHFLTLQELARSRHFVDLIRCTFHVVAVDAIHRTIVHDLRQDVITAVHARPSELRGESCADVSRQIIDRCLLTPDTTTTELTEFGGFVHGECALLAHLHKEGIAAYLYIGTSRHPCQACILFFRSYRNAVSNPLLHYFMKERNLYLKHFSSSWISPILAGEAIHSEAQRNLTKYMKNAYDNYIMLCVINMEIERKQNSGPRPLISSDSDND